MTQRAISLPFGFNSGGAVSYTIDERKIWQDRIVIAVMTSLGERVMRPTFGSNTKVAIFESFEDAIALIKQAVGVAFSQWLTALTLTAVVGTVDKAEETLNIEIFYRYGQTLEDLVTIKTAILNRSGEIILEVPNV